MEVIKVDKPYVVIHYERDEYYNIYMSQMLIPYKEEENKFNCFAFKYEYINVSNKEKELELFIDQLEKEMSIWYHTNLKMISEEDRILSKGQRLLVCDSLEEAEENSDQYMKIIPKSYIEKFSYFPIIVETD